MPNNNYILQNDAITLISQLPAWHGSEGAWINQKDALYVLNTIPAANVKPKRETGFWIDHKVWIDYENNIRETVRCSLCNNLVEIEYAKNYCSNCGAKMEKNKND